MTQETTEGRSSPLGATLSLEGANFSVYSKHATGIELLLFDRVDDAWPARVIRIDFSTNRTYHYWHVFVPGVKAGQIYGYRAEGPYDPSSGMRFDPAKVLLDPYGRGTVVPKNYSRKAARKEGDNCATAMKSVVVDPRAYDWEGDTLLNRPYRGGVDTMLNALNSDQDLFAAEVSLAQTRLAELLSLVQRYKALGGGWQE